MNSTFSQPMIDRRMNELGSMKRSDSDRESLASSHLTDRKSGLCRSFVLSATWLVAGIGTLAVLGIHNPASGFTPDDPVVQDMVSRGLRFIETHAPQNQGEKVLCAYAHYKAEHDESNPVVVEGIAAARNFAATLPNVDSHKGTYEAAVSVLLLGEFGKDRYRDELATLQRYFDEIQRPHGGFTYHDEQNGDVSQTQYAVLAIWALDRLGYKLDYNRVAKCIEWLRLVQDVDGPWPYHGTIPSQPGLRRQSKTGLSMALAGGSSLLIAGDALRVWGDTVADEGPGIVGMPKAVKLYNEDANNARRQRSKLDKGPILQSVKFMNRWRSQHVEKKTAHLEWYFYTVYTTERFESFMEIASGRPSDPSPAWYNQLVTELRGMQGPDGGWTQRAHSNGPTSTAFAVLFLIRSTKKSLGNAASAVSIGGIGFPDDVTKAKMVGGKAEVQAPAQAVTDLLSILEGDDADELDGKALAENAVLPTDPVDRAAQLDRLERLVRGSRSWQARRVAAKVLGTSDELRVVPALIFALSDPDLKVRLYARDGLRFISRKFEGFGMPDKPNNTELRQAQRGWREWYTKMRPGYVFLDGDF